MTDDEAEDVDVRLNVLIVGDRWRRKDAEPAVAESWRASGIAGARETGVNVNARADPVLR